MTANAVRLAAYRDATASGSRRRWTQDWGGLGGGAWARVSGLASSPRTLASTKAIRNGTTSLGTRAPKHFARHIAAKGHAFWQLGRAGFSGGQHGMPSAILVMAVTASPALCMEDCPTPDAVGSPMPTAGAVSGASTSPTTAKIESNRQRASQQVTTSVFHIRAVGGRRRRSCSDCTPRSRSRSTRSDISSRQPMHDKPSIER